MGLFNKETPIRHEWQTLKLMVYKENFQIGCFGPDVQRAVDEALPFIKEFVRIFNSLNLNPECDAFYIPPYSGGYYTIKNLGDLNFEAPALLVNMLNSDNWVVIRKSDCRSARFNPWVEITMHRG